MRDHAPLHEAAQSGPPVLIIYCFEPSLMQDAHADVRHWRFVYESLQDLQQQLAPYGHQLYVFHSEVIPILELLRQHFTIGTIFVHQETGIERTYCRDQRVQAFCRQNGIRLQAFVQEGVWPGLRDRRDWEERWVRFLRQPLRHPDLRQLSSVELSSDLALRLSGPPLPQPLKVPQKWFQRGGASLGHRYLNSFLESRASRYALDLSKPDRSRRSCSRLSPYLAYGNLSAKEVFQRSEHYKANTNHAKMLAHFQNRLWWRSHYIQKLESEYQLAYQAMHPVMRQRKYSEEESRYQAWEQGRTGFPMIDASMRCLLRNGYLNFRMRAMLVTFAVFTLNLDWRRVAHHLAKVFLDFEAGIHYPQIQMQAGLTAYHPLRIFSPIKQGEEHDPKAGFIKTYVPELMAVPPPLAGTPWKMTPMEQQLYGCRLGHDYPAPVVDYASATRQNKDRYWALRQLPEVRESLPAIWERHCFPENIAAYEQGLGPKKTMSMR